MSKIILTVAEARDGKLKKASIEAVSAASRLAQGLGGAQVVALLAGAGVSELAAPLGVAGAAKVVLVDSPELGAWSSDGMARVIADRVKAINPDAVLFAHTATGRDVAPRVAALLGVGLVSDATGLSCDGGTLAATRPVYAGKAYIKCHAAAAPFCATLRPNAFPATADGKPPTVERAECSVKKADFKAVVKEVIAGSSGRVPLQEARVIISGGRGLKGPENFPLLEALVAAFGPGVAALGASRAVVDAGWRPHREQVGQTGKVVAPTLYIAVGISGAIQHLAGMSTSKYIVAINRDAEAPIFKIADYGIVGDALEVVPALTDAVKQAAGEH
jgi:electron transfer flavoprotein alpha subunit